MEDEAAIRVLLAGYLRSQDLDIVEAADGRQGLGLFSADPAGFDLIVTDQSMPGMDGTELAKAAMAIRPEIGAICLSGYAATMDLEEDLRRNVRVLQKPIAMQDLLRNVQEMLKGRA